MKLKVDVYFKGGTIMSTEIDLLHQIKFKKGKEYTEEEITTLTAKQIEKDIGQINDAIADYVKNPTDPQNKIVCINDMVVVAENIVGVKYDVIAEQKNEVEYDPEDIVTVELEDEE